MLISTVSENQFCSADTAGTPSSELHIDTALPSIDMPKVEATLDLLNGVADDCRLLQLKNLCINNGGIWTVPEDPESYEPCLYEAQLFMVPAVARDPAHLPRNWMLAARRILKGAAE